MWDARALRAAGCPIQIERSVTAGGVLHDEARRIGRAVRSGLIRPVAISIETV